MESADTQQISIAQILGILRKHIGLIFASTFIVTLLAAFMTFFVMTPKYSATTQILVNRKLSDDAMGNVQLQQAQADVQMISTYKDIIKSPTVLKKVNTKLQGQPGYKDDVDELKSSISISNEQNSQVFSITAKSTDPNTAAKMANETATTFKQKVVKIMSVNNVSIVSKAAPDDQPVSPRTKLNVLAGLVLGFLIGVGLAFLRELSDRTVTSEEFLTEELGLKGLGIVSEISERDIRRKVSPKISLPNDDDQSETRMRRRV
jgi:capsular polysaccharide biosynthesis protein